MPPLPAVDLTLLSAGAGNYYPKDGETVAVHYVMRVRRAPGCKMLTKI